MQEEIIKTIEEIRPSLQADGGDIEFVQLKEDGTVVVKLKGACHGCPMAQQTLKEGVERYLKECVPGVKEVISV